MKLQKKKKHTFISTGMSNMQMIEDAVKIFRSKNCSFELMHCISAYPFDDKIANLNFIEILRKNLDVMWVIVFLKKVVLQFPCSGSDGL